MYEFNGFIISTRCLEKNFENRPFVVEVLEHPFFTELTGDSANDHHVNNISLISRNSITIFFVQFSCEIKHLVELVAEMARLIKRDEVSVCRGFIKRFEMAPERMYVEDLAALEKLNEDTILDELRHRTAKGFPYTFVGDILLSINSNEMPAELPKSVS